MCCSGFMLLISFDIILIKQSNELKLSKSYLAAQCCSSNGLSDQPTQLIKNEHLLIDQTGTLSYSVYTSYCSSCIMLSASSNNQIHHLQCDDLVAQLLLISLMLICKLCISQQSTVDSSSFLNLSALVNK